MTSKRQRGEGSHRRAGFDHSRFVSKEASDRYEKVLMRKTFVLERGLRPDPQLDGDMAVMIAERNWFDLVRQPRAAVIPLVKEFYANAKERTGFVVQVRGRPVPFDASTINALFNIHEVYETNRYEDSLPELDGIIRRLCKPDTTWTLRIDTGEKVSFPHSALSKYGKAWYAFICANLMPTRHQNDVTKDRAKLLYGIVRQFHVGNNETRILDVDIGMVIQQSIIRFVQGGTSGGIPHGSLITALCSQAGVQWDDNEPLQQPMAAIDHATIHKYRAWDGAISHPRGQGFILPADTTDVPSTAAPSSSTAHAAHPPSPSTAAPQPDISLQPLQDRIETIQRRLSRRRRVDRQRHARTFDALAVLAQRQADMYAYIVQTNTAWLQLFSNLQPGVDTSTFPIAPTLTVYPPSENSDELESLDTDESSDEDEHPAA